MDITDFHDTFFEEAEDGQDQVDDLLDQLGF